MDPEGSLTIHWPASMDSNEVLFLHQNTLIPSTLRQHESAALIDRRRVMALSVDRTPHSADTAEKPASVGFSHARFTVCRVCGWSYEGIASSALRSPSLDRDLALNQRESLVAGFQARR